MQNTSMPLSKESSSVTIAVDALIRLMSVDGRRKFSVLLGAGASISSGMPSAQRCIWEWKREIFITRNPTLKEAAGEISLQGTQRRIQQWLDQAQEFPKEGSAEEYSDYAERCFPTQQSRRSFFANFVKTAAPHTGYQLLAIFGGQDRISTIWTTNFDGLAARACSALNVPIAEVGIDTQHRFAEAANANSFRVVSMHGDYRYDALKNTAEELKLQEQQIRESLTEEIIDRDLLVIGYSGRDQSLLKALAEGYSRPGAGQLFWAGYGAEVAPAVEELINAARNHGRQAFFISSDGFDDILTRFALRTFTDMPLAKVKAILEQFPARTIQTQPFKGPTGAPTALIKSNAHPISFPKSAMKCSIRLADGINLRDWIDEISSQAGLPLVAARDHVFAYGDQATTARVLASAAQGNPTPITLSERDVEKDGRLQSLIRRGLLKSITDELQLDSDHDRRSWERHAYKEINVGGLLFDLHRAFSLHVLHVAGKAHVSFMPEVVAKDRSGGFPEDALLMVIRNQVYGYQHNDVFDNDLKHWLGKIANRELACGNAGSFKVFGSPLCAGLVQAGRGQLPDAQRKFVHQMGFVAKDTDLIFASSDGRKEVRDPNPLRGLVQNRPWDFEMTHSGLARNIEIAVLCPHDFDDRIRSFLQQLHLHATPERTEADYLQEFPGFSQAFGLPLHIPSPGDATWIHVDDSGSGDSSFSGKQLAERIASGLDVIRAANPAAICLIFIPKRWQHLERNVDCQEEFDLHDLLKAYAARRGQSSQLIREKTLTGGQVCRVRWWLGLALYAKGMRTPWRIETLDSDTAFVGIGYSIDRQRSEGGHILLGCSHIYSARGEGLQFRLGKIENPIYRNKRPYMSLDDARRTGETIRQLFFDAKLKLPTRVVIHKRTPFRKEEQDGLTAGLEGVAQIEMLEINFEESLRYLASSMRDGKLTVDKFPVFRGTTVVQSEDSALLWVHGSAPSVANPKFRYYQGKRRIPTPLVLRRYRGSSSIEQLSAEVLGLSKMNWNHFEYYSQLPATLLSASAIAKVGPYLSGFTSAPYDYRLLI